MARLGNRNPYRLSWQSQVGPSRWQGPQTIDALKGLHRNGNDDVLLVPVAFTSDHIETLFELDLEYGPEAKEVRTRACSQPGPGPSPFSLADAVAPPPSQLGMNVTRAPSLNDSPTFARALADLAASHLAGVRSGAQGPTSAQMALRCPGCTNDRCRQQKAFFQAGGKVVPESST